MSDVYKVLNRVMPACLFCTKLFYFCVVTPKAYFQRLKQGWGLLWNLIHLGGFCSTFISFSVYKLTVRCSLIFELVVLILYHKFTLYYIYCTAKRENTKCAIPSRTKSTVRGPFCTCCFTDCPCIHTYFLLILCCIILEKT